MSAAVFRAGLREHIRFVICPALITELEVVFARPKFERYASVEEVSALVDAIAGTAEMHDDPEVGEPSLRDPGDEYLRALATTTGTDLIVSGDRDLLDAQDTLAVTPRGLLDRLESAE